MTNAENNSLAIYGIKGVSADHTVAMATYCLTKMIATYSPMTEQFFFDTMIVASSDKEWL